MKIYNTLTRKKEEFIPLDPNNKKVGMYVCGPTVYGPAHIGHARTFVAFDLIRRYLEYSGYKVNFISNITDVHDDIIKKALEEGGNTQDLADKFLKLFLEDLNKLNIEPANKNPRVSENISQIIDFIEILVRKGFAYENNGSVYFDVSKFSNYGKLSGRNLEKTKSGTRVDMDKFERDEAIDFALWKKTSEEDKKVGASWNSPWGEGRPGWHIECSAMNKESIGEQVDIHGGSTDLIFPHHENEIAQSEAASGKSPFVKYWMHSGLLFINGQKMAKSLGNFITIKDILSKDDPRVLRFLVISTHYRSVLNFSEEAMKQAKESLSKIDNLIPKLNTIIDSDLSSSHDNTKDLVQKTRNLIIESLNDDFNTPQAIAELFKFIKEINILIDENKLSSEHAKNVIIFLKEINNIFQIIGFKEDKKIPENIQNLLTQREIAKKEKNYKESDKLRNEIERLGYIVEDTQTGQVAKKK